MANCHLGYPDSDCSVEGYLPRREARAKDVVGQESLRREVNDVDVPNYRRCDCKNAREGKPRSRVWRKVMWFTRKSKNSKLGSVSCHNCDNHGSEPLDSDRVDSNSWSFTRTASRKFRISSRRWKSKSEYSKNPTHQNPTRTPTAPCGEGSPATSTATGKFCDFGTTSSHASSRRTSGVSSGRTSVLTEIARELNPPASPPLSNHNHLSSNEMSKSQSFTSTVDAPGKQGPFPGKGVRRWKSFAGPFSNTPHTRRRKTEHHRCSPYMKEKCYSLRRTATFNGKLNTEFGTCLQLRKAMSANTSEILFGGKSPSLGEIHDQDGSIIGIVHFYKSPNMASCSQLDRTRTQESYTKATTCPSCDIKEVHGTHLYGRKGLNPLSRSLGQFHSSTPTSHLPKDSLMKTAENFVHNPNETDCSDFRRCSPQLSSPAHKCLDFHLSSSEVLNRHNTRIFEEPVSSQLNGTHLPSKKSQFSLQSSTENICGHDGFIHGMVDDLSPIPCKNSIENYESELEISLEGSTRNLTGKQCIPENMSIILNEVPLDEECKMIGSCLLDFQHDNLTIKKVGSVPDTCGCSKYTVPPAIMDTSDILDSENIDMLRVSQLEVDATLDHTQRSRFLEKNMEDEMLSKLSEDLSMHPARFQNTCHRANDSSYHLSNVDVDFENKQSELPNNRMPRRNTFSNHDDQNLEPCESINHIELCLETSIELNYIWNQVSTDEDVKTEQVESLRYLAYSVDLNDVACVRNTAQVLESLSTSDYASCSDEDTLNQNDVSINTWKTSTASGLQDTELRPPVLGKVFKMRTELMLSWFEEFNDEQKNIVIKKLLDQCELPQMHLLSVAMEPNLHKTCPPNCQDMLVWLPYTVTLKIFLFLDIVSLCQCNQVNKAWNELTNNQLLWQNLTRNPDYQLSESSSRKQLQRYTLPNGAIHWKKVLAERYLLQKNWLDGKYTLKTFNGHNQGIACVQFDDTRIVSGSSDKTIKLWDISNNTSQLMLTLAGHSGTVRCLDLNGNRLVSGSTDRTIKVWDLSFASYWAGASCKVTMVGHLHTVRCLQADDKKLVSGSYDKTVKVWDLKTGQCQLTLRGHTAAVLCVRFDEQKIVSGSYDKKIKVWDLSEGTCLMTLDGHHDAVTCLNLTHDGMKIITGSLDYSLKFWDLYTGKCYGTLDWITSEGHTAVVRCLQVDSWRIISGGDDKTLKVWELATGQRLLTLRYHSDGVTCMQFNDFAIVSGSYDRTVKLWDFTPKHPYLESITSN